VQQFRGWYALNRSKLKSVDFYFVTDSRLSKWGTLSDVEKAIRAGCSIVQYREKYADTRQMISEVKRIKQLCSDRALFLINDRVDVALAIDADGVHIGQDDMPYEYARKILGPEKIIGVTVHDVNEAVAAEKGGADYVGLSPIFVTSTKEDAGNACGVSMVAKVRESIHLPIVAIGGIIKANVADVICAGADAVCAISAVVASDDVYREVGEFIGIIQQAKEVNNKQ
jgi:thiamine-phosphate pyrophosphorylase